MPLEDLTDRFRSCAARLFLNDLLDARADGDPGRAVQYPGKCHGYDQQAGVLAFIDAQKGIGDLRELSRELCREQPWNRDMDRNMIRT